MVARDEVFRVLTWPSVIMLLPVGCVANPPDTTFLVSYVLIVVFGPLLGYVVYRYWYNICDWISSVIVQRIYTRLLFRSARKRIEKSVVLAEEQMIKASLGSISILKESYQSILTESDIGRLEKLKDEISLAQLKTETTLVSNLRKECLEALDKLQNSQLSSSDKERLLRELLHARFN